jgi:hypothetical protein
MPILGRGDCTCLWYEQTCCLAWNDPPKPVGVIKGDDYTSASLAWACAPRA